MKTLDERLRKDRSAGLTRGDKIRQRLVAPVLVAAGIAPLAMVVVGDVKHSREVSEILTVSGDKPHKEVALGGLGDIDGNPATPEKPMTTLWDLANAASIPNVSPADVVTMLAAQVPKNVGMGELQPGMTFMLPTSSAIGIEVNHEHKS